MKKLFAVVVVLTLMFTALAGCGSAKAEDLTFEAYVDWIMDEVGSDSPDPDGFRGAMLEASSWDAVDGTQLPWMIIVNADMYNFTPYDQWVENGGTGSYNADFSVDDVFGTSDEPLA